MFRLTHCTYSWLPHSDNNKRFVVIFLLVMLNHLMACRGMSLCCCKISSKFMSVHSVAHCDRIANVPYTNIPLISPQTKRIWIPVAVAKFECRSLWQYKTEQSQSIRMAGLLRMKEKWHIYFPWWIFAGLNLLWYLWCAYSISRTAGSISADGWSLVAIRFILQQCLLFANDQQPMTTSN